MFHRVAPLIVYVVTTMPTVLRADDRLEGIIQNVRANERLYENLELVLHEKFAWVGGTDDPTYRAGIVTVWEDIESRFVYQGGLMYYDRRGRGTSSPDTATNFGAEYLRTHGRDASGVLRTDFHHTFGYDGEKTRVVDGAFANIHVGRFAPRRRLMHPHSLIFLDEPTLLMPLSEYLTAPQLDEFEHRVTYEGQKEMDGLRCARLRSDCTPGRGPPDVVRLWLAVDRNYLPVRMEIYGANYSRDIPLGYEVVSDLRELAPGVWCPFAHTKVKYADRSVAMGKPLVQSRRETQVTKAVLDPQYDLSLFRDIPIPDGMPVIEIKEGEKLRDYLQGNAPPPAARWSWWWLVVCLVAAVVLGVLWKRRTTAVQRAFHP